VAATPGPGSAAPPAAPRGLSSGPVSSLPPGQTYGKVWTAEDPNPRYRMQMEDAAVVIPDFCVSGSLFVAIFDGHGGRQAVDYVTSKFHHMLERAMDEHPHDIPHAMTQAFLTVDDQLRLVGCSNVGTTAVVALCRMEGSSRVMYVANVGDSRAVLINSGDPCFSRASYDHKASDPLEAAKVAERGGIVLRSRVGGQLAVTRALGDHALKKEGLTAEPFIQKLHLDGSHKALVLATDGVWDVLRDDEVAEATLRTLCSADKDKVAEGIVQSSLAKGTRDNVCVAVIGLQ